LSKLDTTRVDYLSHLGAPAATSRRRRRSPTPALSLQGTAPDIVHCDSVGVPSPCNGHPCATVSFRDHVCFCSLLGRQDRHHNYEPASPNLESTILGPSPQLIRRLYMQYSQCR
jgi:hypothetical protein